MSALTRAGYSEIVFPSCDLIDQIVDGRNIFDGYRRGVNLEFTDISEVIAQHPLFIEATSNAQNRSVMDYKRTQNLFLIITCFFDKLDFQNIIEFGSYRGGSAIFMATLLQRLYPNAKLYACDTYEGMPATDHSIDLHRAGDFSNSNVDEINELAASLGLTNLITVKGLVEDTFPAQFPQDQRFALSHIDLDIYHPIRYIQKAVHPFMTKGGYMVYDDATVSTCLGATQAVEEWISDTGSRSEQIFPHFVFRTHL